MLPFICREIRTCICIHIHTYAYFFSNISEDVYTYMLMYIFLNGRINKKLVEVIMLVGRAERKGQEWKPDVSKCSVFCQLDLGARQMFCIIKK